MTKLFPDFDYVNRRWIEKPKKLKRLPPYEWKGNQLHFYGKVDEQSISTLLHSPEYEDVTIVIHAGKAKGRKRGANRIDDIAVKKLLDKGLTRQQVANQLACSWATVEKAVVRLLLKGHKLTITQGRK